MIGSQVAKIIESKHPDFPVGKRVVGYLGWRTHTIINQEMLCENDLIGQKPYLVSDLADFPSSLYLGVLGMPG